MPLAPQLMLSPDETNGVRQPATSHFEGPRYQYRPHDHIAPRFGFMAFAPVVPTRGPMFTAAHRTGLRASKSGESGVRQQRRKGAIKSVSARRQSGEGTRRRKGPIKARKVPNMGRIWVVFARFFAFLRRDFRKFLLMINKLSALCTKRSAPFFDFKAKMEQIKRTYGE